MKRKVKITRIAALLLAMALFFNNEQVLYALAETVENPVVEESQSPDSTDTTGTCEHEWVTNPEDSTKVVCSKCGKEQQTDSPGPVNPDTDTDITENCEHEWVTDSEDSTKVVCSKCGKEQQTDSPGPINPDTDTDITEECEHEWVTDPEDSTKVVCSKCGKEQQAGDIDLTDPDTDTDITEECEHEWVTDPEDPTKIVCSKCGKEQTEEDLNGCEHEWIRDPATLLIICSMCGEYNYDYVEEDECPEGDFHVYQLKEDGTGYVCAFCGAEKETLDALDVTMEMYVNFTNGQVDLLDATDPDSIDYSKLPKTLDALNNYDSNEIIVSSLGDLLAVQQLSQQTDLAGYKIQILRRTVKNSVFPSETWDLRGTAFTGLGTEEYPFRGELYSGFDGLLYKVDDPFFQYLSTDAVVKNMRIQGKITENTTDSKGILAGVLVKGENAATSIVTMDGVVINGIDGIGVSNSKGAAGMVFGKVDATDGAINLAFSSDQLRFCSEQATVSGLHAGGLAGETIGDVTLDIKDPGVTGNVIVKSYTGTNNGGQLTWDAGAAGMYIGAMQGGTLTIAGNSTPYTVYVGRADAYGGVNGGFVGMAIGTDVKTTSTSDSWITISGASGVTTGVVGRTAGGVLGYYESDNTASALNLKYITVNTSVNASNSNCYYAGGILGHYYRNVDNGDYDTIDDIKVSGTITSDYFAGGVIGYAQGSYLQIGGEENDSSIAFSGTVTENSTNSTSGTRGSGGIAGCIRGKYVEIRKAKVTSTTAFYSSAPASGGIVGVVGEDGTDTIIKIKDVDVNVSFNLDAENFTRYRGGLLGWVDKGSMVSLDGNNHITIGTTTYNLRRFEQFGNIAGYQNDALIYLEEGASYTLGDGKTVYTWRDDIGNYGGVYKNDTRWKEKGENLFSYEQGGVTGEVSQQGGKWIIDSEADFIRLAVMLNSDGRFAANCFGNTDKTTLLRAEYSITENLDLTDSGIYSLNRNDNIAKSDAELFKGSFIGNSVTIDLGSIDTRQRYLALFPTVGDGAEVSGFTLNRTITGGTLYGAGIACKAYGDFTAEDLTVNVNITAYNSNWYWGYAGTNINTTRYYGGLVSQVDAQGATTLAVNNVKIGGTFSNAERDYGVIGGMVADYYNTSGGKSIISVDGYELLSTFSISTYRYSSGMITCINSSSPLTEDRTILSMKDIKIHDGASITENYNDGGATSYVGGWLGYFWRSVVPDKNVNYSIQNVVIGDGNGADAGPKISSYSNFAGLVTNIAGRIQLKNIDIKNATFVNSQSGSRNIGLLFYEGLSALIEIDGYRIDGCEIRDRQGASAQGVSHNGNVKVTAPNKGTIGNFDEIVLYNIGTSTNGTNSNYTIGGVVNIIYDDFSDVTSAQHYTYQDRLFTTHKNSRTRYYYNLFGNSFDGESDFLSDGELLTKNNTVITNERQMMIWHLSQYMSSNISRFITEYYVDQKINAHNDNITFKGNIDLAKVSYYPTSVTGGTYNFLKDDSGKASTITFYGKEITDNAGLTSNNPHMKPSVVNGTHYMMHSGLFLSNGGNVTVQGDEEFLTLTGSISKVLDSTGTEARSGALFTGEISGEKNIYRIRLKDLYVADYVGDASDHSAGLLIGKVNDNSDLDISWIETTENYQIPTTQQYAAAALIGIVGTPQAKDITIEFTNLKLDSRNNGGVFRWASLIDQNYYVEDRTTVSGNDRLRRIRYLFTEYAFTGEDSKANSNYSPFIDNSPYGNNSTGTYTEAYVTIGRELEDGIEFWDNNSGPENNTSYDLPFNSGFKWGEADNTDASVGNSVGTTYLPYVHTDYHEGCKEIEVNPKNLGILKGCGTYEDPYQIEDARQILALARYLQNKNDYKYLGGWKINDFESGRTGGTLCDGENDSDHVKKEYPMDGNIDNADFPSQEELSQAYYVITKDIDLSDMGNSTDKQIAEDFIGLGTPNIPFRGVIIGKKQDDGTYPTITLPIRIYWTDGANGTTDTNHGLIQYAKGAVVKDLNIKGGSDSDTGNAATSRTGVAKVKDMAGGVIACVLGGDNIIDNVTVDLRVALADTSCQAGAYVGNVKQGSVILRNLKESSASKFNVGTWRENQFISLDAADGEKLENCPYVSGLIGKVEDGCVIYEDDFNSGESYDAYVLAHGSSRITNDSGTCIYSNEKLPICKHYDIIVNSKLDKNDKIKISSSDGMNFTANVTTNAQLQIVSMAINSDAFSIYYGKDKTKDAGGYDDRTSCRKAKYDATGLGSSTNTSTGSDWNLATANDDAVYYYPYLYDYFDFSGVTNGHMGTLQEDASGSGNYTSKLNAATEDITAIMNYELLAGGTYDMSVYDRGFRGLGATYGMLEVKNYGYGNAVSADQVIAGSFYSDFRANFNGNGATIKLGIDRSYDKSIHTAALFNDLLYRSNTRAAYSIRNFTVTGNVVSVDKTTNGQNETTVTTNGNSAYPNRTAAVIGLMRQPWVLEDITVKDMTIEAKGHAAGVVAWIDPESGTTTASRNFNFNRCSVEGNTKIYSYGGSVGGVIGVMTQHAANNAITNVQLNLNGCTVKGTDADNIVDIEVVNRTSFNTSWHNGYSSTYYVQYATGRSGGLVGYIGPRYAGFSALSATVTIADDNRGTTPIATRVERARIVGAYSTGGLVGEYDAVTANINNNTLTYASDSNSTVMINRAQVENCEIEGKGSNYSSLDGYYAYGVGGLIGEMRGYELKLGDSSITTSVTNTNISSTSESMPILNSTNTINYGMYTGGVVGSLSTRKADITNVFVKGDLATSPSELELGGQQYTIKSVRADAGGVIGRAGFSQEPELTMSKIQVSGMNITVGDWTISGNGKRVFTTAGGPEGCAGGVIGRNEMLLKISGTGTLGDGATVDKCLITAAGGNAGGNAGGSAGGIIGGQDAYQGNSLTRPTRIEDIKVLNSIIGYNNRYIFSQSDRAVGAGGVYGKLYHGSSSTNNQYIDHQLENAEISGCWIYGFNVGGVLGYGDNNLKLFSNEQGSESSIVNVHGNNIYGIMVGGAIGYCQSSAVHYIGTEISDNHLQAYRNATGSSAFVGGFGGYVANGSALTHDYRLDFITIRENDILAANVTNNKMISAGGFFGYSNWTNCYVYRPELVDNLIGYSESDNGSAFFTGQEKDGSTAGVSTLQKLFNSTDGEISKKERNVYLIKGTAVSALSTVEMPDVTQLKTNTIGYYAGRIGNFIGTYGSNAHTYFLAPEISYDDAVITTRPVIDVGMTAGTTSKADASLLDVPYAYREKIHIIYHEAETETTIDRDAQVWDDLTIDGASTGNWKYLFDGISYENIIESYKKAEEDNCSISEYLDAYPLGVKAEGTTNKDGGEYDVAELYEMLYRNAKGELLTTLKVNNTTPIPMIVLDTQYGKADELIKGVVAALTGVGGVYNSDSSSIYSAGMGAITSDLNVNPVVSSITVTPMQINSDGSIAKRANTEANLVVMGSSNRWTIDYNGYDNDGSLNPTETKTFTLLTIKYNWTYSAIGDSNRKITRQEEINIPIFVVERLNIDTHFKIIGDLVYNADNAKENGVCSPVTVANDSSYTIYAEYIYDEVRKKYAGLDIGIDKQVGMSKISENGGREQVGFAPGTKLTLIDICDNNKVYYYTVKEGETGPYSYTLFKDADGNNYKNKDISKDTGFETYKKAANETFETYEVDQTTGKRIEFKYTDVAVERFLINVDTSGVKNKMNPLTGMVSISPHIPTKDETDDGTDLAARTTLEDHTNFLVTILEGMTISFYGKDQKEDVEKTWITGNIQADEDGFVDIWATINIHASPEYWKTVAQDGDAIDSANRNKYLELQVYMSTENSDQEILLPNGTNVVIDATRTEPSKVVVSDAEGKIDADRLDTYTDASSIYFYKDGSRTFELDDLVNLILEDIRLDEFDITAGTIRWVDHLKLDFRNADMTPYDLEHYKMNLRLLRIEDAAYPGGGEVMDIYSSSLPAVSRQDLACAVETKDLMQLGINIYENQTKMPHTIDFDFKLNFEGIFTYNDATDKVNTDQLYTVVYRILEKQYDENGELKYKPYEGDQISLELVNEKNATLKTATSLDGLNCWYVGYRFDWNEIKNGTKYQVTENEKLIDKQEEGVVVRSLKLTVKDAAKMDLSNYQVQAVVYVNAPTDAEMSPELINLEPVTTDLTDFFVFTVAELKTDLDY